MNEIEVLPKNSEWYDHLIDECKTIVVEKRFRAEMEFIECWHELGSRILQDWHHFDRSKIYGQKIATRVSESLGVSSRTIERSIRFAKKYPDLQKFLESFDKNVSWKKIIQKYLPNEENIALIEELKEKAKNLPESDKIKIWHGSLEERGKEIEDNSVDLILTDPPYPKEFLPCWCQLSRFAKRVLKPGGFLIAYSGQLYLPSVMEFLGENLEYYWIAALHHKGKCAQRFEVNVFNAMKPILIYFKKPCKIQEKWLTDLVESPAPSKDYHEWGQSIEPIKLLIETFSQPNDLVVDPFAGGGTTALACKELLRRNISIEIEEENIKIIKGRLCQQ